LDANGFEGGPVIVDFHLPLHFFGLDVQNAVQELGRLLNIHDILRDQEHLKTGAVVHENSSPLIQDHSTAGRYLADSYPVVFGQSGKFFTTDDLEVPEPQAENEKTDESNGQKCSISALQILYELRTYSHPLVPAEVIALWVPLGKGGERL
jgi:hypothetical protein